MKDCYMYVTYVTGYVCYAFIYMTVSKRHKCSDGEQTSSYQRLGMQGGCDYEEVAWGRFWGRRGWSVCYCHSDYIKFIELYTAPRNQFYCMSFSLNGSTIINSILAPLCLKILASLCVSFLRGQDRAIFWFILSSGTKWRRVRHYCR